MSAKPDLAQRLKPTRFDRFGLDRLERELRDLLATICAYRNAIGDYGLGGTPQDATAEAEPLRIAPSPESSPSLLASAALLMFNRSDSYTQVTPVLGGTGGALTQQGSGVLTLSGANLYSGATTVANGTLLVTGSIASGSAVTVANGATLGGTGTAAGSVTVNGTLSPGASATAGTAGTLSTGALTLAAGSTLAMDLGTPGTTGSGVSDLVQVNGDVNLSAAALKINALAGFSTAGSYTLMTYTGTRVGTFSSTNLAAIGYLGLLQYDDANKQIKLVAMPRVPEQFDETRALVERLANFSEGPDLTRILGALRAAGSSGVRVLRVYTVTPEPAGARPAPGAAVPAERPRIQIDATVDPSPGRGTSDALSDFVSLIRGQGFEVNEVDGQARGGTSVGRTLFSYQLVAREADGRAGAAK